MYLLPRFAEPTEDDQSQKVWITAILMLCFTTLTLAVRVWVRWGKYSWDDAAVFIAQILAYGQFGAVAAALVLGLGRKWKLVPDAQQDVIASNVTAAKVLYLLVLGFLKMGVTWPIRRLYSRMGGKRTLVIACTILLGTEAVWTLASIIVVSIGCSPNHILPSADQGSCAFITARWGVVLTVDVIQELALVTLSFIMLSNLKNLGMEEKLTSMLAFALRPGIIAFAILAYIARKTATETQYLPETAGYGLAYTNVQLWQEVQLTYSMITATLPFVLGFMRNFDTNVNNRSSMSATMMLGASKIASRGGTAYSKQAPAFAGGRSERLGSEGRLKMPSVHDDVHKWDQPVKYSVKIFSHDDEASIDRSLANASAEMIIRREDTVTVQESEKV